MANKRSNRNSKKFFCPHCENQLWRVGSTKHYVYFEGLIEVKDHFKLSRKNAIILVSQSSVQTDLSMWVEEFYCETHDRLWLIINKCNDGSLKTLGIANDDIWKRTTKTIDPNLPNASVSEHTYKMSRGSNLSSRSKRMNPL